MSIVPPYVAACHVSRLADDAASAAPHPPVAYLSASKTTFGTDQYHRVLDYIVQGFPGATILDAASLWRSAEHWRPEYEVILAPVNYLVILPNEWGYVGRGSYTEWTFLAPKVIFCGAFVRDDALWTPVEPVLIDPQDWVNFAAICHLATGELSVPGVDHGA